ncbi:type II secretion system minor pseudopilin GspJ [Yersinia bercovieri]|uniref:Type II secretion system protein J n=3 Tax=Yersinia bercovieri TaxID=634 RepID=A0A2G4U5A4_YERBE|nr:type II secretion system minor pseudopilin GspJ [Yersinia bercovieri]MCB5303000.1 type II secretion system minor pseudopilin GspJ [Yersinia bercovieri]MDN0103322.1 type II secretion system minor pseudopilin GspJ [Yersinia bercovieri]PHZ27936.1 type II secretion system protein GspJ [Yersinia bercovieri]QKJ05796.1 type II secretion system minor pseudopilin GspJ [Yersinia bercovieri ATCC 43970]
MLLISKTTHCGFTLLEMLLSVAIFTMMSLMAYQVLMIVTKSSVAINKKYKQISELESVINKLDHDISHITIHQSSSSNHNDYLDIRNKLLESDEFGLYLLCEDNNSEEILFHYQSNTLGYRLKNKKLERISASNSDDLNISDPEVFTMVNSIVGFRMRIYHKGKWVNEWNSGSILPRAVEVTIEFEGIGTIRRVIILLNSQTELLS